jgi:hypothetical protein
MPLRAEEIDCPTCELKIVFIDDRGEVMVQMVTIDDPCNYEQSDVQEYRLTLAIEALGDMHLPPYLPVSPQRADLVEAGEGSFVVKFSNRVALEDLIKR